jgi:hypothetical protein
MFAEFVKSMLEGTSINVKGKYFAQYKTIHTVLYIGKRDLERPK